MMVKQPASWEWLAVCLPMLFGALVAWWEVGAFAPPWSFGMLAVYFCLAGTAISTYAGLHRDSRRVVVDRTLGVIEVHQRNWLPWASTSIYSLSRFNRIRSVLMLGRSPKVQVELSERDEACALPVAGYFAVSAEKEGFSLAKYVESEEAARLRGLLAAYLAFPDLKFMGSLWRLPASKPNQGT